VAAAAAAVRRQIADPGFQAWLQQQQQQKAQREAQAAKQKELERRLQACGAGADRLRKQQAAAELAKLNSQLQQQQQQLQQQQQQLNRPVARPLAQQGSAGGVGWEADVVTDPSDVLKSDVGLTPAQMAALLDNMGISSSSTSSSSRGLQAPVLQPKQGYSFSSDAAAASSRLAAASTAGKLQRPLLVRPAARPTGTGASRESPLWADTRCCAWVCDT
jgi:DNA primase